MYKVTRGKDLAMRKITKSFLIVLSLLSLSPWQSQGSWAADMDANITPPLPASQLEPLRTVSDDAVKAAYAGAKYKKQVRNLRWQPDVGWNGLVVGKSTLSDAERKFGPSEKSYDGPGETQYVLKAPVRLWIADDTHVINAIEVYLCGQFVEQTPLTVRDAQTMYGPLKQENRLEGCTVERSLNRPGLTVNARSMDKNGQVTTLFFTSK